MPGQANTVSVTTLQHCWLCVGNVPYVEDRRTLEIISFMILPYDFAVPYA